MPYTVWWQALRTYTLAYYVDVVCIHSNGQPYIITSTSVVLWKRSTVVAIVYESGKCRHLYELLLYSMIAA
jgi:hypothetical protein